MRRIPRDLRGGYISATFWSGHRQHKDDSHQEVKGVQSRYRDKAEPLQNSRFFLVGSLQKRLIPLSPATP